MLLVVDFATENSLDYFLLNWDTYSNLTGPDKISVTSDSLLILVAYSTNRKGWMLCAEVVSASDDPHVSTVIKTSFDLWRTGWSTFVQVRINGIWLGSHDVVVHTFTRESESFLRDLPPPCPTEAVAAGECGCHVDRFEV